MLLARSICPSSCGAPALTACYLRGGAGCRCSSAACRGAGHCCSLFPPAAGTALESTPNALGCPAAKGRGEKPKPASAPAASFRFIHRTSFWPGGAILTGRRKGTAVPIPPCDLSSLHCTLPSCASLTWQSNHVPDSLPSKTMTNSIGMRDNFLNLSQFSPVSKLQLKLTVEQNPFLLV